jgi:hypothetical protein
MSSLHLSDLEYYSAVNHYAGVEDRAAKLESQGWKPWLMTMFPFWFGSDFSDDQLGFWELRWSVLMRYRAQKREDKLHNFRTEEEKVAHYKSLGIYVSAKESTAFEFWGRGLAKSATIEAARIMYGSVLDGGYSLIVSETDDQAQEHLGNCRILIEHPDSKLLTYYPNMAITETADALKGMPTADRKEMFICKNGWILRAKGLAAKMRGLRVGNQRPTEIALDDIDDVNDSLMVSMNKERLVTASILPVLDKQRLIIDFGQNLITEHSFATRLYNGKSDALAERTIFGVTNAFTHLDVESKFDETGKLRHFIKQSSIASWQGLNIDTAQRFLDNSGLKTFLAEYQNEFNQYRSGRVIPNYNEEAQVITWSQFEAVFGQRRIPKHWQSMAGLDVGYSEGQYPHYSAWVFMATAAMNSGMPGSLFLYRGRSFLGTSIDDQATRIKAEMYPDERIVSWQMSHERTGEMLTLQQKYHLPFYKFRHYKAEDGVAQWKHMSICDRSQPNPFKDDEWIEEDGKQVYRIGRPSLYYVVDDDQLKMPTDDAGLRLFREQVSTWEYVPVKLTDSGQTVQKPSKVNDDFCDCTKSLLAYFGAGATEFTREEKIISSLSEQMQNVNEHSSDYEKVQKNLAMQMAQKKADQDDRRRSVSNMGSALNAFSKNRGKF